MSGAFKALVGHTSRARVDVVSESLCDDILRILAPSLGPYIGGTIIDYLPGAGIFTRKLHEYLKPRRHILVEPEWEHYGHYLEPLLSSPNSKYLRPLRSLTKHYPLYLPWYIDDGIIPEELEDNNATLQVVNATSPLIKALQSQPNSLAAVAHHFSKQCRQRSHFHSRGPTRLLAWCEDKNKFTCVPRSVDHRRTLAVALEAHCRVEEVMGFGSLYTDTQREQRLNDASSARVQRAMEQSKIQIPSNRREYEKPPMDAAIPRKWHGALADLEAAYEAGEFPHFLPRPDKPARGYQRRHPMYSKLAMLQLTFKDQGDVYKYNKPYVDEQIDIDALYRQTSRSDLGEGEIGGIRKEVEERQNALWERMSSLTHNKGKAIRFMSDEHYAYNMAPSSLLQWDTRNYEPLTASPSEFLPNRKLSLLDFQARPEGNLPLTEDQERYFELIARTLFSTQGHHSLRRLDYLAPGAYDALIPKIAELTDGSRGGKEDPEWLACRTLTPEMLWRLAIEWDRWLFKPPLEDISTRSNASEQQPLLGGMMKKQRFTNRTSSNFEY